MIKWDDFITSISEDELKQVISDYEQYSKDGFIGECVLRSLTRQWTDNIKTNASVTIWMERIAFESYKYFAHKYLRSE